MIERQFLAIPSVEDKRDYVATMIIPTLQVFPESFRISYSGEIKNQGMVGSCVAHSAAYCREIVEQKQSGTYKKFSVGFVYANRLSIDYQGEGMMPRDMLKSLQADGDVLYEDFPYNEDYPLVKTRLTPVKESLLTKSRQYRISSYARLNDSDEVKSALMQLGPATLCMPVYKAFNYLNKQNAIVPKPIPNEQCQGYHEVTIVGWTTINKVEYWVILNSWGPEWGDGGYFYMPFDYPIAEIWSMTDNIVPQPSPEPSTHKFYRVQSKKYTSQRSANALLNRVKALGYPRAVLNMYEDKYVVQVCAVTEWDKGIAYEIAEAIKKQIKCGDFSVKFY